VTEASRRCETPPGLFSNASLALQVLWTDGRVLLLGVIISCFEGAMYAFIFSWTPALNSVHIPPPHGVIFALFMMSCMCGSSASTLMANVATSVNALIFACSLGMLSFIAASWYNGKDDPGQLTVVMAAFMLFEFSTGIYFPCVGLLKSEIVPEQVRGTLYNILRVPLNAIVIGLLLSGFGVPAGFRLNAALLLTAVGCLLMLQRLRASERDKDRSTLSRSPLQTNRFASQESRAVVGRRRFLQSGGAAGLV